MFKKDLIIPALLGLGVYAQNSEISLCNNTTMLLALYVLLEDHSEIQELKCECESHGCHHDGCCHDGCHRPAPYYYAPYAAPYAGAARFAEYPYEHGCGCGHSCGCGGHCGHGEHGYCGHCGNCHGHH